MVIWVISIWDVFTVTQILGQFLSDSINKSDDYELVFVWNRDPQKLSSLPADVVLKDLYQLKQFVSHKYASLLC